MSKECYWCEQGQDAIDTAISILQEAGVQSEFNGIEDFARAAARKIEDLTEANR